MRCFFRPLLEDSDKKVIISATNDLSPDQTNIHHDVSVFIDHISTLNEDSKNSVKLKVHFVNSHSFLTHSM